MKLVVFGATGKTGRRIVAKALAGGHEVVAAARRPEALAGVLDDPAHPRLRTVKADVLDAASVTAAVAGADAVLSAIGPTDDKHPGTLISEAVQHMTEACARSGVRRFVFESGLMVGEARGLSWLGRLGVSLYRRMNRALAEDKRRAEATVVASSLDWVIVRPPALDESPPRGDYKTGVDLRINPLKKLSHADVAAFMVEAAVRDDLVRTLQEIGR